MDHNPFTCDNCANGKPCAEKSRNPGVNWDNIPDAIRQLFDCIDDREMNVWRFRPQSVHIVPDIFNPGTLKVYAKDDAGLSFPIAIFARPDGSLEADGI